MAALVANRFRSSWTLLEADNFWFRDIRYKGCCFQSRNYVQLVWFLVWTMENRFRPLVGGMTTEFFQTAVLILASLTLFGVGGIIVWIFNLGQWKGMVDSEIEGNREDHRRYEELFMRIEQ